MTAAREYPIIGRPRPPDASDYPRLDSRRVTLTPGAAGAWIIDGRPCVAFEVFEGRLHIAHDLLGEPMAQRMTLIERARGPARIVFGCSRCSEPAMVLYLRPGPGLVCRACASRLHRSAKAAEFDRHFRIQRKIERRLGRTGRRPAHMPEPTYKRLCDRLDRARIDMVVLLGIASPRDNRLQARSDSSAQAGYPAALGQGA